MSSINTYSPAKDCAWIGEENSQTMPDTWHGGCGIVWTLTEGSPNDNSMIYCPLCGRKIKTITQAPEPQECTCAAKDMPFGHCCKGKIKP